MTLREQLAEAEKNLDHIIALASALLMNPAIDTVQIDHIQSILSIIEQKAVAVGEAVSRAA